MKLSDRAMHKILDNRKAISAFIKDVENEARNRIGDGQELKGYKLVESRKVSKLIEEDFNKHIDANPSLKKKVYIKKLVGLTELKKVLGKKVYDEVTYRPEGIPVLVDRDDNRPEWESINSTDFKVLEVGENDDK